MSNGGVRIEWTGKELALKVEGNLATVIKKAALDLKRRSSEQAPIDTGDLRGNCSAIYEREILAMAEDGKTIESPTTKLTGRVGYSLPYARIQHEDLGFNHPKGGKAKYLEDPANAMSLIYKEAISKATKKGIKIK